VLRRTNPAADISSIGTFVSLLGTKQGIFPHRAKISTGAQTAGDRRKRPVHGGTGLSCFTKA
jgi:hypothetical protein